MHKMDFGAWLLLGSFFCLMVIRVPIAFSLGISSLVTCLYSAIIMAEGGIAKRILDFASILVGRLPGGLAMINIVGSMFFGGTTGSSVADVASIGPVLIPMMEKKVTVQISQ